MVVSVVNIRRYKIVCLIGKLASGISRKNLYHKNVALILQKSHFDPMLFSCRVSFFRQLRIIDIEHTQ